MTVKKDEPTYPIGSVDKALRLVVLVSEHPSGIRIGEAAGTLGVAPSTAHRLLQMLVHRGFARQDPETKAYYPGETLDRLSDQRERARQVARPILASLVEESGETVHLCILDGWSALTIASVESPHLLRVGNREGHAQPAVRSGMGRVLLSGKDAPVPPAVLESAGVDPERFEAHLAEVEANGYLLQHGEVEHGVSALAVPVYSRDGESVDYAIGLTYPTGRIPEESLSPLVDHMKKAAVQLANELHR
ncbi:IclR family transcriptional regulator [Arthrobacter sp. NPDC055585]